MSGESLAAVIMILATLGSLRLGPRWNGTPGDGGSSFFQVTG